MNLIQQLINLIRVREPLYITEIRHHNNKKFDSNCKFIFKLSNELLPFLRISSPLNLHSGEVEMTLGINDPTERSVFDTASPTRSTTE